CCGGPSGSMRQASGPGSGGRSGGSFPVPALARAIAAVLAQAVLAQAVLAPGALTPAMLAAVMARAVSTPNGPRGRCGRWKPS
ncbi:MAG TPA: hypothetical protein VHF26_12675, partial [Trebonia sp.]|nr:hypothetical protein [Trebonia sp.]